MSQCQEVFQRYEKKYLLSGNQYEKLRKCLQSHMAVDQFGRSTICNIYFDTPDYRLIRTSLEKPIYKEKLRLRSYGVPSDQSTVFIELKKKYKGVVYKRRVDMTLKAARNYLVRGKRVVKSSQIIKEVDWVLNFYQNMRPAMFLSYERIALYGIEDPNLRLTFDENILWRQEDLALEQGIWGNELLEPAQRLLEIKIPAAMPLWLSRVLDELEVYPISFSKYGMAFQQSCSRKVSQKEEIICA